MVQERLHNVTGFRVVGDEYSEKGVGILFGYPVEAEFSKKEKHKDSELVLAFTTDQSGFKIKDLRKVLRDNPELLGKVDVLLAEAGEQPGNMFQIKIKATDSTELASLYNLTVKTLEEGLKELMAFAPPVTCKICGSLNSDTLANVDNALNYAHKACLEQKKQEARQAFEEKSMNPKRIEGFLGGIIGGAVGAIPALIALAFFSYFVGILYALIPLGIFYGWKLLKGKLTKMTTVFTIIYTLLLSFFVWVLSIAIIIRSEIMYELGFNIPLGDAIVTVFEFFAESPDLFMEYMLTDALFAFGSAVVGIWIVWRQITRTDEDAFSQVQALYDEAIPLEFVTTESNRGLEPVETGINEELGELSWELSIEDSQPFDSGTEEGDIQRDDHTV